MMIQAAQVSNATKLLSVSLRQSCLRTELSPAQLKPGRYTSVPIRCIQHDQSTSQRPSPFNSRVISQESIKQRVAVGRLQNLSTRSWRHEGLRKKGPNVAIRSFQKGLDGDSDGWDPSLELGVPEDQRPVCKLGASCQINTAPLRCAT